MSTETTTTEKVKLSPSERAQAAADKAAAKVETAQAKVDKAQAKIDDATAAHDKALSDLEFAKREAAYRANHPLIAPAAAPVEDETLDVEVQDEEPALPERDDDPYDQNAETDAEVKRDVDEFNPFA